VALFKTVCNGDTAYVKQLKTGKTKKVLLLLHRVVIISTCSQDFCDYTKCVVQQQKADTFNIWCKNCRMW